MTVSDRKVQTIFILFDRKFKATVPRTRNSTKAAVTMEKPRKYRGGKKSISTASDRI